MLRCTCSGPAAAGTASGAVAAAAAAAVAAVTPGCAALAFPSIGMSDEELELADDPACWLSLARNMAVKRLCLVFGPGCEALVSWSCRRAKERTSRVSSSIVAKAPCRETLARRPGCAALVTSTDLLNMLGLAVVVAVNCSMLSSWRWPHRPVAGCLLREASRRGDTPERRHRFVVGSRCAALVSSRWCGASLAVPERCATLLAGAPLSQLKLPRSLLPSEITACCNSVIKVAKRSISLLVFLTNFPWQTERAHLCLPRVGRLGEHQNCGTLVLNKWCFR